MPVQIYTVIIVGAGPGGLSAAAQAHANHVDYLLFDKEASGNTPGFSVRFSRRA
jgi:thioredoxin reductase